jgi:hypothetical protein
LAIYASLTVEKEACRAHGLDPDQLSAGVVIGLVDLVGIVKLDQAGYVASTGQHLSGRHYQEPLFGWELANPRPLPKPVPARGRLMLFEVDLPDTEISASQTISPMVELDPEPGPHRSEAQWGSALPFELRVIPEAGPQTRYRLALYQRSLQPPAAQQSLYRQPVEQMERVVELGGVPLRTVVDQALEALRENGYKATDLNPNWREPFALQEAWGVRLGLLFLAVKPISKATRIEIISAGIRQMTSEELYYWYSKCTNRVYGERAQKALRLLLSNE